MGDWVEIFGRFDAQTPAIENPEIPSWVPVSALYVLCKPSYSQFCAEIHKFSSPWQQGRCEPNFTRTILLAVPDSPTLEPKL